LRYTGVGTLKIDFSSYFGEEDFNLTQDYTQEINDLIRVVSIKL